VAPAAPPAPGPVEAAADVTSVMFFEVDVKGESGEETDADADAGVCVGGAVARLEDGTEGGSSMRAIARGMADDDDP